MSNNEDIVNTARHSNAMACKRPFQIKRDLDLHACLAWKKTVNINFVTRYYKIPSRLTNVWLGKENSKTISI